MVSSAARKFRNPPSTIITWPPKKHTARSQVEKERQSRPRLPLLLDLMAKILQALFIGDFKTFEWEFKVGRRENK